MVSEPFVSIASKANIFGSNLQKVKQLIKLSDKWHQTSIEYKWMNTQYEGQKRLFSHFYGKEAKPGD